MNLYLGSSLIIITGQTATGKTKFALDLAKKNKGELINCDSRQIYKYLNIITGKDLGPDKSFILFKKIKNFSLGYYQINSIKIWLYDIIDPKFYFSSYDWVNCAKIIIKEIIKKNKTPIIVGGTYFYLKHLLYGFETENIPPNWLLRQKLKDKNINQLQKILSNLNKDLFNSLNQSERNNPQRLIRKIEIEKYKLKNKSVLSKKNQEFIKPKVFFGLRFKNKEKLKKEIEKRVEERLKKGAIEEVETLLKKGYDENNPGLKTIGYQELINYLKRKISKNTAIDQWILHEIQYAKRQYTFMKQDKNINWIEV